MTNYPAEGERVLGFLDFRLLLGLQLDHIYSAWYFYGAIGLLAASLAACTYTTQLPTAKARPAGLCTPACALSLLACASSDCSCGRTRPARALHVQPRAPHCRGAAATPPALRAGRAALALCTHARGAAPARRAAGAAERVAPGPRGGTRGLQLPGVCAGRAAVRVQGPGRAAGPDRRARGAAHVHLWHRVQVCADAGGLRHCTTCGTRLPAHGNCHT